MERPPVRLPLPLSLMSMYVREPDDPNTTENNTPLLAQWRRYVESEDRLLYFINGNNSHYSPDGASSVVEAIQTFKQKSIRTVYNVKKARANCPPRGDLKAAWRAYAGRRAR